MSRRWKTPARQWTDPRRPSRCVHYSEGWCAGVVWGLVGCMVQWLARCVCRGSMVGHVCTFSPSIRAVCFVRVRSRVHASRLMACPACRQRRFDPDCLCADLPSYPAHRRSRLRSLDAHTRGGCMCLLYMQRCSVKKATKLAADRAQLRRAEASDDDDEAALAAPVAPVMRGRASILPSHHHPQLCFPCVCVCFG